MPTNTDIFLKSHLDSNQRDRERMCLAILACDPNYEDVRPRHPLGGPDGGRDLEATRRDGTIVFGAVGFCNGANDSVQQKAQIKRKFSSDLLSALKQKPNLTAFVFFTNIALTIGNKTDLIKISRDNGIHNCDIFDRERLRIELDSPSGFFIRFQYLSIPLSDAEQASFLARYGDQIQRAIAQGFNQTTKALDRLLFFGDASRTLEGIAVKFNFTKPYSSAEIGHFRVFPLFFLRQEKHQIMSICFGIADIVYRFMDDAQSANSAEANKPGFVNGFSFVAWEGSLKRVRTADDTTDPERDFIEQYCDYVLDDSGEWETRKVNSGWAIGCEATTTLIAKYTHDDSLIRYRPRLTLNDIDDCSFIIHTNNSLIDKISSFEVIANGYKLLQVHADQFYVTPAEVRSSEIDGFTDLELSDRWVSIRPANAGSAFEIHFSSSTPRRLYAIEEI